MIDILPRSLMRACALGLALTLALAPVTACGPKHVVDVTARTGLSLANAIGAAQKATHELTDLHLATFPPQRAIVVQEALLRANTELGKLPQAIRLAATAEVIQGEAAKATPAQIDAWLTILKVVSTELGVAINGFPVESAASKALQLSKQAQTTAGTFALELAKFKAATAPQKE